MSVGLLTCRLVTLTLKTKDFNHTRKNRLQLYDGRFLKENEVFHHTFYNISWNAFSGQIVSKDTW